MGYVGSAPRGAPRPPASPAPPPAPATPTAASKPKLEHAAPRGGSWLGGFLTALLLSR